jgi:hypothetical protein
MRKPVFPEAPLTAIVRVISDPSEHETIATKAMLQLDR